MQSVQKYCFLLSNIQICGVFVAVVVVVDYIREFKIYDATVTKMRLKIANSSLSVFLVIISVCVTFKASTTTQEPNRPFPSSPKSLL